MKKLTLFKGRAVACLFLMCFLLAQGCRKDLLQSNSPVLKRSLSVDEARAYFDKNVRKQIRSKVVMGTGPVTSSFDAQDIVNSKQPMWDASMLKDLSIKTNAVLTPLHKEGVSVHVSDKKMVKFGFLNYMMMYKNEKDSIITEWIELKPCMNWINSTVSRRYEGRILVRDWDGTIKRVIAFGEDNLNKTSTIGIATKKLSGIRGTVMTGGDQVCFYRTTYSITSGASTCSCKGHTYAQWAAGGCTCGDVPRQGYTTTISYETTVDCINIEPDEPIGPGGGTPPSSGGGPPPYPGHNGGGGTNPGDYNPIQCNPNPIDTSVPLPSGQEYAIPCSEILIPDDDIPGPNNPTTPLTATELLIHYYNADPNIDMHLSDADVGFLNSHSHVVEELRNYLQAETVETKETGRWVIGYLSADESRFNQQFRNFLNSSDDAVGENENYNSSLNLNIPSNLTTTFSSNGFGVYKTNGFQTDTYPETHPVSVAIANYNEFIYRALIGANNTSVKHMHLNSKGLASSDAYAKGIGAIGEGIFAQRVTTEYPTSPGGNMYIGYYINTTHIDALQEHFLPGVGGSYYGLQVNYTDIYGNPLSKKMEYPDPNHSTTLEKGRIAYEIKTNSANRNSESTLYQTFLLGINQTVHRANISGIDAGVLVMDFDAWKKLINSSYNQQVIARLNEVYNIKNSKNEQKIYLRIEKNLWSDANKAYWDILGRIKNL
ncbi:hypothetical protein [Pedobacter terrae]|uniref:hypothetical protein n=1 Tax=Pedobacter terrae TaxID=405671 RepID=UPI002FFCB8BE